MTSLGTAAYPQVAKREADYARSCIVRPTYCVGIRRKLLGLILGSIRFAPLACGVRHGNGVPATKGQAKYVQYVFSCTIDTHGLTCAHSIFSCEMEKRDPEKCIANPAFCEGVVAVQSADELLPRSSPHSTPQCFQDIVQKHLHSAGKLKGLAHAIPCSSKLYKLLQSSICTPSSNRNIVLDHTASNAGQLRIDDSSQVCCPRWVISIVSSHVTTAT